MDGPLQLETAEEEADTDDWGKRRERGGEVVGEEEEESWRRRRSAKGEKMGVEMPQSGLCHATANPSVGNIPDLHGLPAYLP